MTILSNTFGAEYVFDPDSGHFISAKHQRVAEVINEYNPDLFLAWIPPKDRTEEDSKPFAIIHRQADGFEYVVSKFTEEDINENLVATVFMMDHRKHDVIGRLRAQEAARQALRLKEEMEKRAEQMDRALSMVKSPFHTYQLGKGRKVNL